MLSNILLSLLLLLSYTEGAFLVGKWLYNGDIKAAEETLQSISVAVDVVVPTVVEPEKKRIILKESIDPIHHNFIRYAAPVLVTESKISEYNDGSDPMEQLSHVTGFGDRLQNTVNEKMLQLIDLIDLMKTLEFIPSQLSESRDKYLYESDSFDSSNDDDKGSNYYKEDITNEEKVPALADEEDIDAFEVVLNPNDQDMSYVD